MIIAAYFEKVDNTKTDICAECKIEIIGNKYQLITQIGGPMDLTAYELYLCERCAKSDTGSDTRT